MFKKNWANFEKIFTLLGIDRRMEEPKIPQKLRLLRHFDINNSWDQGKSFIIIQVKFVGH